ncbi:flagellin lysine-N-methylase [Veillonella denticariosi]|uniref:flagellin lysine-N-methylase n=1 Tax=Veillonella denticariosi TaxID=419208 RepID=UPI0024902E9C|nr:flagellin lysine-N-methylase [Veillonella denticariosi]
MISIYPTIYHTFQCKADKCENTCCQLWTIDIDEATARRYRTMHGPLGESLRRAITVDDKGSHFVFTDKEPYCPLLNEQGLCRVVLELGEEGLCETCHMHPRFYKYIEDLELCGVGLACEASVELLEREVLQFTIKDDDNEFDTDETITLLNVFQLLGLDLDPDLLRYKPTPGADYYANLLSLYKTTEPIDATWTAQLNDLSADIPTLVDTVTNYVKANGKTQYDATFFNKVYQYILYRQIDMLADHSLEALFDYAKDGTEYILMSGAINGKPLQQVARWSQQIEYDEDNVELLLQHYDT